MAKRAQHVAPNNVAICCVEMLRSFGWGLKLIKFFMQHLWMLHVACKSRLARFVQQCCARACALLQFSKPHMSQHVATGWPNARNMLRPTLLRYVVLTCRDRLAEVSSYIRWNTLSSYFYSSPMNRAKFAKSELEQYLWKWPALGNTWLTGLKHALCLLFRSFALYRTIFFNGRVMLSLTVGV